MRPLLPGLGALLCAAVPAAAQSFPVPANLGDSATLARAIPPLARQVLASYAAASGDSAATLDNVFRLQIAAGRFDAAGASIVELRGVRSRRGNVTVELGAADVQYEIWARAKALAARSSLPFAQAFSMVFRQTFATLDDPTAALVIRALSVGPQGLQGALNRTVQRLDGRTEITLAEALALVRAWQRAHTHADFAPPVAALVEEDDARRYVTQRDVRVRTPDGATVCALIMRPRGGRRRPALITFTIYVDSATNVADARRAASHAYVGVTAFTRGKACSPDAPVPYRYDGADAAALIDWIAAQPWSDGRVGMYGGSYNGFTTWATTKRMPRALKAIMVGAPVAPGIDVPMEGNIVWNFVYPWPLYTTANKTLDTASYFDNARWRRLYREWYVSGRAYRDLEGIDGTPNPVFAEWISHPSYDAYWRAMIPNGEEFAKVNIPVLQTAGYYYGGPGAALYYFTQHYARDPGARHYLVIGPYDHFQAQRGVVDALGDTATVIAGYQIDPVARIDIVADLRYRWFDWILKGGARPALLGDRVNYQVMGANVWRHAPSVAAMASGSLRLFLTPEGPRGGRSHRLGRTRTLPDSFAMLRVDLAYRADIDSVFPGGGVRDSAVNTYEALEYVSDPIDEAIEVSGLYSGHLELLINKRDFDLSVQLYELTPGGDYVQLPPFQVRASHARDPSVRRLLTPGARETLDFTAIRLISRRVERGSRIVAVVGPIKQPGQQINYGSGKDVSDETVADAGEPLEIRWFGGSYIDLPVRRGSGPAAAPGAPP